MAIGEVFPEPPPGGAFFAGSTKERSLAADLYVPSHKPKLSLYVIFNKVRGSPETNLAPFVGKRLVNDGSQ